jgi:IclR family transcriptional regulator, KDG regulon repressor
MIQVIHRALDILEIIANKPDSPTPLGEIADKLNLNHGTCANIIKTLVSRKYLEQTGAKKGYVLGLRAFEISGNNNYRKELVDVAKGEMQEWTAKVNENCLLAILKDEKRLVLYSTNAEHDLQVRTLSEKDSYNSASGRLLIALLPDKERTKYINKYGLPTVEVWLEGSSRLALINELDKIKNDKLAIQVIPQKQVIGVAVPILKMNEPLASLSTFLPIYRYEQMNKKDLINSLNETALKISSQL